MTPPEDVNAWPMVEQSVIPCVIIVIEKGSLFSCDIWIFGKFLIIRIVDLEHYIVCWFHFVFHVNVIFIHIGIK